MCCRRVAKILILLSVAMAMVVWQIPQLFGNWQKNAFYFLAGLGLVGLVIFVISLFRKKEE